MISFDTMMRTIDQKLFYKMIFLFFLGCSILMLNVFGCGWINRQLVLIELNLPFVDRS